MHTAGQAAGPNLRSSTMKKQDRHTDPAERKPAQDAGEQRSGEGSASALARLRMQERAKAAERAGKQRPELL